ncbi:MAG: hypothetical protein J6B46_06450 [Parabacteroides sp.]|nr:hypothetical protein [Parabacteroides sp.]
MKKDVFKKSAVGFSVLATISSCEKSEDIVTRCESMVTSENIENSAISLTSVLSNEEYTFYSAVQKLADDILDDPEIANRFSKNPQKYMELYGYRGDFEMDDGLIKLALAYSDENIRNTLKNGDLKEFVRLCKDKNVFFNYTSKLNVPEKIANRTFLLSDLNEELDIQPTSWFWFVEWIAVALAGVGTGVSVNSYTYEYTYNIGSGDTLIACSNMSALWNIKANSLSSTNMDFFKEYYKESIKDIMDVLKLERPELFKQNTEIEIESQILRSIYGRIL